MPQATKCVHNDVMVSTALSRACPGLNAKSPAMIQMVPEIFRVTSRGLIPPSANLLMPERRDCEGNARALSCSRSAGLQD